jgi:CRP-like cAMP-binding protein
MMDAVMTQLTRQSAFLTSATASVINSAGIVRRFSLTDVAGSPLPAPMRRGESLYRQGDKPHSIYELLTGVVRAVSLRHDGRRLIHGFHLPGDIFGMEIAEIRSCSVEAVSEGRFVRCEQARLHALCATDPAAASALCSALRSSIDNATERFSLLGLRRSDDKVMCFLWYLAERTGRGSQIELPVTRYDIADYLGISSETVSRAFTALRARGFIAGQGRSVRILRRRPGRNNSPD